MFVYLFIYLPPGHKQGPRRCLLTRRVDGISDEDTIWYVMKDWAQFQPRLSKPRQVPGQLYYPPEYSHILEKYWNVLNNPVQHPDCVESLHSRDSMRAMTAALSEMDLSSWIPQPNTGLGGGLGVWCAPGHGRVPWFDPCKVKFLSKTWLVRAV
jgi:hypothetical protein